MNCIRINKLVANRVIIRGNKKISQLDVISDANLSGEGILPVVVSDPLIPNRKVKINQLHKGVAQGTKAAPGLC